MTQPERKEKKDKIPRGARGVNKRNNKEEVKSQIVEPAVEETK